MTTTALPTLTARTAEDVLAAVPLVLGFVPDESVVMLTSGATHPFHARLDLPVTPADCQEAAGALVGPAVRHGVRSVLFVFYADDPTRASTCATTLVRAFADEGIDVVDVLRSDGRCWFEVPVDGSSGETPGTPYDVSSHRFTAEAVLAGRVTRSSRTELAATVAADPDGCAVVSGAARQLEPLDLLAEGATVRAAVARWAGGLGPPDPATSARVLVALRDAGVRDAVLSTVDRAEAERQLPVWSALVRSAPVDLVAPVASVLAFLAWLSGDGALAWCALERAAVGVPPCSLADHVAEALEQALPPAVWEQRR